MASAPLVHHAVGVVPLEPRNTHHRREHTNTGGTNEAKVKPGPAAAVATTRRQHALGGLRARWAKAGAARHSHPATHARTCTSMSVMPMSLASFSAADRFTFTAVEPRTGLGTSSSAVDISLPVRCDRVSGRPCSDVSCDVALLVDPWVRPSDVRAVARDMDVAAVRVVRSDEASTDGMSGAVTCVVSAGDAPCTQPCCCCGCCCCCCDCRCCTSAGAAWWEGRACCCRSSTSSRAMALNLASSCRDSGEVGPVLSPWASRSVPHRDRRVEATGDLGRRGNQTRACVHTREWVPVAQGSACVCVRAGTHRSTLGSAARAEASDVTIASTCACTSALPSVGAAPVLGSGVARGWSSPGPAGCWCRTRCCLSGPA